MAISRNAVDAHDLLAGNIALVWLGVLRALFVSLSGWAEPGGAR